MEQVGVFINRFASVLGYDGEALRMGILHWSGSPDMGTSPPLPGLSANGRLYAPFNPLKFWIYNSTICNLFAAVCKE